MPQTMQRNSQETSNSHSVPHLFFIITLTNHSPLIKKTLNCLGVWLNRPTCSWKKQLGCLRHTKHSARVRPYRTSLCAVKSVACCPATAQLRLTRLVCESAVWNLGWLINNKQHRNWGFQSIWNWATHFIKDFTFRTYNNLPEENHLKWWKKFKPGQWMRRIQEAYLITW